MEFMDASTCPSLLPYLGRRRQGIYFQFTLPVHDEAIQSKIDMRAPGALTSVRHAQLTVDGSETLLDMVCIQQSDHYAIAKAELKPLTNKDVEDIWQRTWSKLRHVKSDTNPFVLPCQVGEEGLLIPFRPLFHCLHTGAYGHPLCPICGQSLLLCRDDDLLASAGLDTYSGSLLRYLYCPSCHQDDQNALFYARTVIDEPSAIVGDSATLIEGFNRLLTRRELSDQLPCIGCKEAGNCYGPQTTVLTRMRPVQFYPFHMLLQKMPTFNALEFLALLSGAEIEEIDHLSSPDQGGLQKNGHSEGRNPFGHRTGFLFGHEDRLFLEILYLKLTFLQELAAIVQQGASLLVSQMTLEGIGVEIGTTGASLPGYWNFSLNLMDPIGAPERNWPGSKISDMLSSEFLSRAWFYALLANGRQSMVQINTAIRENMAGVATSKTTETERFEKSIFDPGNIFWAPHKIELPMRWRSLWIEALGHGYKLVRAGKGIDSDFSLNDFGNQLQQLRQKVHQELFRASAAVGQAAMRTDEDSVTPNDSDGRIADLLSNILSRWPGTEKRIATELERMDLSSPPGPSKQGAVDENGDRVETVILLEEGRPTPQGRQTANDLSVDIEETVIISPPDGRAAGKADNSDLKETVIVGTDKAPAPGTPQQDEALDETVVIGAGSDTAGGNGLAKTVAVSPQPKSSSDRDMARTLAMDSAQTPLDQEDLEKTVLIPPQRRLHTQPETESPNDMAADEQPPLTDTDELEETVVIEPTKKPDRKPKP